MPQAQDDQAAPRPAPTAAALFGGFARAGLTGFGGVLPIARRVIVERQRWLTAAEFTDLLALCQFLPGANIANLSVVLGGRFRGARGAVAALSGLLAGPMVIVIALGIAQQRYGAVPLVARGMGGLSAAASGLVLATALRIAAPLRGRPRSLVITALAFLALALLGLSLPAVLAVLVPISIALHWPRGRAA